MTTEEKLQAIFDAGAPIFLDFNRFRILCMGGVGLQTEKFQNVKDAVDWLYAQTVGKWK